jgi:hypothetical protein
LGSVSISSKIFSRNCTAYGDIAHCMSFFFIADCVMVPEDVGQCEAFKMLHIFMQSRLTDGVRNASNFLQWDFIVLTLKEGT